MGKMSENHTRDVSAKLNFHFSQLALENLYDDQLLSSDEFDRLGLAAV